MPRIVDFQDGFESATQPSVSGASVINIEYHTVTSGEISAKQFTLTWTPADSAKVLADIVQGSTQENGVDFSVSGNVFTWNSLALDGVISANDIVRVYEVS